MLATVKRWGNSYAIRLTTADLRRLHLRPGQTVQVDVRPPPEPINPSSMPSFPDPQGMGFAEARADYYDNLPKKWGA